MKRCLRRTGIVVVAWALSACTSRMEGAPVAPSGTGGESGGAGSGGGSGRGGSGSGQGAGGGTFGGAGGTITTPPGSDAAAGPVDGKPAGAGAIDASGPVTNPPAPGECAKLFGGGAVSEWVYYDSRGKLAYKALNPQGDRIMDFSHAGYRGGGVAIPTVPVAVTIGPSGGDDTTAIQAAIDMVSAKAPVNGFRGAVLLKAGSYKSASTINITTSGVVLRGSGAGMNGTIIDLTDTPHVFLRVRGGGTRQPEGPKATMTDSYVPAGATSFTVDNADGFKVGDPVLIGRPVTEKWIAYLGMDKLVRDGSPQTWLRPGFVHSWERTITAIDGKKITLDVPLSDSFDAQYVNPPGGSMQKFSFDGRISQVGIENLRVTAPLRTSAQANDPGHGGSQFMEITNTVDSWVKGVAGHNTVEGIHLESGCNRITVEDTVIDHDPTDYFTASAPFDFNVSSSQVLIHRSASKGGNKIMMFTTHYGMGPNVLLNFDADGPSSHIQPHMHWATGLLVDSAVANSAGSGFNSAIAFMNRGTGGSGHGWAIGWGVAWNCVAPTILMQQPPGSMVWAIGCKGTPSPPLGAPGLNITIPNGIFESLNTPVAPKSLYLAQLCDRLGQQALANIGY